MIKIILNGCGGRMGIVINKLVNENDEFTITAGVDIHKKNEFNYPVYKTISEIKNEADVIIDFSNREALKPVLDYAIVNNVPAVLCTTGYSKDDMDEIISASKKIAVFQSANMSIGINLLKNLGVLASKILYSDFDIEIVEKHHNRKADAPSGTALYLADSIKKSISDDVGFVYGRHSKTEKRKKNEIGIHAIRGGNIVGDHEVIFAGDGEVIELKHSAISRDVFGIGALKAAAYIKDKKAGFYNMDDLIMAGNCNE